jgi:hypothetical protein
MSMNYEKNVSEPVEMLVLTLLQQKALAKGMSLCFARSPEGFNTR